MKWSRLLVFSCVVGLAVSPATAQEAIRLRIEVSRDGAVVAKPELRVQSGREGRLELNGESVPDPLPWLKGLRERIAITPTVRGDDVAIALTIASGERQFTPALVMSKDIRVSVQWSAADGQPITLALSWVP